MPRNQFQRMVFAFITVVITVHAYVFFSLHVIHGGMFKELTGEAGVLAAISKMGGVPVFGRPVPIWVVVLIEFVLAFTLENLLGSPLSFTIIIRQALICGPCLPIGSSSYASTSRLHSLPSFSLYSLR